VDHCIDILRCRILLVLTSCTVETIAMELTSLGGILGLLHIVIAIWAIMKIINSGASTIAKVLWILGVLAFPLIGLIVWFVAGPKG